jgi:hypothetical protein
MASRPHWYIVVGAAAVVALGLIASLAIPVPAQKETPQARYVTVDDEFEQRVLERLDRLSERLERLEARVGERDARSEGNLKADDLDAVRESLKALEKSLESNPDTYRKALEFYRDSDRLRTYRDGDFGLKILGPQAAYSLDSEVLGDLKEALQDLAKEHGKVEFELKDGDWDIEMKGNLDPDAKRRIDKIVEKIQSDDGPTNIQCTVDEDGNCMLSIATVRGDSDVSVSIPEINSRIFEKFGDKDGNAFKLLTPKKMPEELREKLKALDEEHKEKRKKLLKEHGFDEDDFPLLRWQFGDGLSFDIPRIENLPHVYRFEDGDVLRGRSFELDEGWLKNLQEQLERLQDEIEKQLERREMDGKAL